MRASLGRGKGWIGLKGGAPILLGFLLSGCLTAWLLFSCLPIRPAEVTVTATATSTPERVEPTLTMEATPPSTITPEPTTPTPAATAPPEATETTTPTSPPPRPPRLASPEYGMQAFLWWRPETAWRDLDLVKGAGFTWVKQVFAWVDIEGAEKGAYDWSRTDRIVEDANSRGLHILAAVFKPPAWLGPNYPASGASNNYQDLADFLAALATRYKGRIRAYSVWNEPNISREWGAPPDPEGYAALLKVAYRAIKAADPKALVISAGLSPTTRGPDAEAMPDTIFVRRAYQAGAAPYFDLLGIHAPGYKAPPELDPAQVVGNPAYDNVGDTSPPERHRAYCFRHAEDLRQIMVEFGDSGKQVAILEFGWTSDPRPDSPYRWHAVSEEEKADYLVRAYQYAKQHWAPWIGLMSLIYISDPDWGPEDEQYWWAITEPDGSHRPAYVLLSQMEK